LKWSDVTVAEMKKKFNKKEVKLGTSASSA